jgi:hypothetical protein
VPAGPRPPEGPVLVEFQVQFAGGPKSRRQAQAEPDPASPTDQQHLSVSAATSRPQHAQGISLSRVPKITQLLVLGHHFEKLVREGLVKDYAEIARLMGLSRARVTQTVNLTLLAPDIQEVILTSLQVNGNHPATERCLRRLSARSNWLSQKNGWSAFNYYP